MYRIVKYIPDIKDVEQLFKIDRVKHLASADFHTEFDAYKVTILLHDFLTMFDDMGYSMLLREDAYYRIMSYHMTSKDFAKLYQQAKNPLYAFSISKTNDTKRFFSNGDFLNIKFQDTDEFGIDYEFERWMFNFDDGTF